MDSLLLPVANNASVVQAVSLYDHQSRERHSRPAWQSAGRSPPAKHLAPCSRSIESDGIDVFVVYNGVRIAKRGDPNTEQAGTWVSLKPGYRVFDKDYPANLIVECDDKSSAIGSPG